MVPIEVAAYGRPVNMVAEYGALDINRKCGMMWRYYAMLIGDGQYDVDGFMTVRECREWAADMRRRYGCQIVRV